MAKSDDLIKYVTKQAATYITTAPENRVRKVKAHEPFLYHWFGMVPMALGLWLRPKRKPSKQEKTPDSAPPSAPIVH